MSFILQLRRSLIFGDEETYDGFDGFKNENDDNGGENHPPNFDQAEHDLLNSMCNMDTEVQFRHEKVRIYELCFVLYQLLSMCFI